MVITSTDFTVCVVVKNRRELMGRCLDAIQAQSCAPGAVVVVDNGSSDGTFEMLTDRAAIDGSLTILRDRGSLGSIRNRAVRAAQSSHIAFTDSDCEPAPDWLSAFVTEWNSITDARLASVQGTTRPNPRDPTPWWSMTQTITSMSGRYEACNISYDRAALLATPGFDERIGYFGEDSAAGWHLERAGRTAHFSPSALVLHAVLPVGLTGHVRRAWRYGKINRLLKLFPEQRARLVNGVFLTRRTRLAWLLIVGIAALIAAFATSENIHALLLALGLLLTSSWAAATRPDATGPITAIRVVFGRAVVDVTMVIALVIGSLRHRCLVL